MNLDPSLVATYKRDGVVVLRNLVPTDAIEQLRHGVEANMKSPGPWANEYTPVGTSGRFFDVYVNWQRIPQFEQVGTTGSVPQAALDLMATKTARMFHEHVLVKESQTREVTPWHHDDP